jgi:hypothetical protein
LGERHEALDALAHGDERAVLAQALDAAGDDLSAVHRALDVDPRALCHLLEAQADALAALLHVQHAQLEALAQLDDLGRALDARVREVRDVHETRQAVAEGHEGAVGLDADHAALHDVAGLDRADVALVLAGALALLDELARDDHALALAIDLEHLHGQVLAHQETRVLVAVEAGVRLGQEGRAAGRP